MCEAESKNIYFRVHYTCWAIFGRKRSRRFRRSPQIASVQ
jgi:hypothetical protein